MLRRRRQGHRRLLLRVPRLAPGAGSGRDGWRRGRLPIRGDLGRSVQLLDQRHQRGTSILVGRSHGDRDEGFRRRGDRDLPPDARRGRHGTRGGVGRGGTGGRSGRQRRFGPYGAAPVRAGVERPRHGEGKRTVPAPTGQGGRGPPHRERRVLSVGRSEGPRQIQDEEGVLRTRQRRLLSSHRPRLRLRLRGRRIRCYQTLGRERRRRHLHGPRGYGEGLR
mmetsp:Transcript_37475/g.76422  ORF Transcript_37475/g.76422 Transcript_37475/m.76422 type:complete len:221 (-) Transcript_37475:357-1019(-)